jgi:hypothetical protein
MEDAPIIFLRNKLEAMGSPTLETVSSFSSAFVLKRRKPRFREVRI